jgi:hypothetical protein
MTSQGVWRSELNPRAHILLRACVYVRGLKTDEMLISKVFEEPRVNPETLSTTSAAISEKKTCSQPPRVVFRLRAVSEIGIILRKFVGRRVRRRMDERRRAT